MPTWSSPGGQLGQLVANCQNIFFTSLNCTSLHIQFAALNKDAQLTVQSTSFSFCNITADLEKEQICICVSPISPTAQPCISLNLPALHFHITSQHLEKPHCKLLSHCPVYGIPLGLYSIPINWDKCHAWSNSKKGPWTHKPKHDEAVSYTLWNKSFFLCSCWNYMHEKLW